MRIIMLGKTLVQKTPECVAAVDLGAGSHHRRKQGH